MSPDHGSTPNARAWRSSADWRIRARISAGLPWPSCATSKAASPATCGAAQLVPMPLATGWVWRRHALGTVDVHGSHTV